MNTPAKIWVTVVKNPFDPRGSRVQRWFDHSPEMTPYDCVKSYYPLIGDDLDVEISINGRLLAADEIKTVPVGPGCNVVFCAVPHGGGGDGAKMLRTVAMIAVMVVATYVSGGAGGAAIFAKGGALFAGGSGAAIAGAAVAIGGAMLVNAVLPPVTPDLQGIENNMEAVSPTYAWGAAPNIYQEGGRWPVLYGTRRITPPILAKYIKPTWDETTGDVQQSVHILMAVADHAVDSIADVEINGSPIANFEGASYETKLGALDQTVVSDFYWQRQQTSVGEEISTTTEWTGQTTGDAVTSIEVGLLLPAGLYYVQPDGTFAKTYYIWTLYYKAHDAGSWTTWKSLSLYKNSRKAQRAYAIKTGLTADQYDIKVTVTRTPPEGNQYSPQESYVEYFGELINEDFTYPGASLLAVKALATGQISGSQPTITCVATRSTVSTAAGDKPANLPAWQAYDAHCNSEYGENIATSQMIIADFTTWASFCTANSLISNIYIDNKSSLVDACAHFEQIGRGRVVQRGTQYGAIVDTTATPVQLFGIGNIVENSFEMSYIDSADQANIVQVSFFDEDNDYIKRIAQVTVDGFDPSTDEANIAQITLFGCTDSDTALKHATYLLNGNTLQLRTVSFEAGFDAIACQAGDVIRVAYDAINWGQSGRVLSATTSSAVLDRNVTLTVGESYVAVVQHQDDDTIEQASLVTPADGLPSDTIELYMSTWTATPAAGAVISIGTTSTVNKLFRVAHISRASDQRRKIEALEYNEDVYDDTVVAEPWVAPDTFDLVEGLAAQEIREVVDGTWKVSVSLTWRGASYRWRVYYRENGSNVWIYLGQTDEPEYSVINLLASSSYDFAVTDMFHGPDSDSAETVEGFAVTGWANLNLPIYLITGLQISESANGSVWYGRDLKLDWNVAAEFWPETADGDPGGAETFSTAELPLVYRVRISSSDGTLRCERIVKEAAFIYSYEDNYLDGSGTPSATLSVSVWARNMAGMESSVPATLYITNPAPATPTGVTALAWMGGVKCYWNANTDPDINGYQVRYVIDTATWTPNWTGVDWVDVDGTEFIVHQTNTERLAGDDTAYFQVRAKDTFGNYSSAAEDDATADDFYVVESELATALQTKITNSEETTSKMELLDDQWTVKIQEDDYIAGMGLAVYEEWDSTTTYVVGEYCVNSTVVYECTAGHTNQEPPNASYWDVVPYGAKSEVVFLVDKFLIVDPDEDDVQRAPFIVGNVGGVSTVGVNGALIVDGTVTATQIEASTITASEIKGTGFGDLTISSGTMTISTSEGLTINTGGSMTVDGAVDITEGADLKLHNTASDWAYLQYYYGATKIMDVYLSAADNFVFRPYASDAVNILMGTATYPLDQFYVQAVGNITLDTSGGVIKCCANTLPETNKGFDLGTASIAWDTAYADDFTNVADMKWMDTRLENGVPVDIDDIDVICNIQPSSEYDPITGLRLIDDNSLPLWLLHRYKQDGDTWKAGDIAYTPDGKPYLSLMTMIDLLMGASRQFDMKFKIIQYVLKHNNLITDAQLAAAKQLLEGL